MRLKELLADVSPRDLLRPGDALDRMAGYDDFRRVAFKRLPRVAFEFVDGGAGAEVSLRENRAAFERVFFEPRWLSGVSQGETATTILGQRVSMPVLLAPAGMARIIHPEGELAAARAAGDAGTVFCLSGAASHSIEQVADVATGPLWLQLFPWRDEAVLRRLLERAVHAGYHAIVVTVDSPTGGNRERDVRHGATLPPSIRPSTALNVLRHPRWLAGYLRGPSYTLANLVEAAGSADIKDVQAFMGRQLIDVGATWDRFSFLRRAWDGPLLVKGVLSRRDALEAVDRGADGVIVSNHGGRQLDSCAAPLDVLPEIVEAVGENAEVLMDGGVRRGEDAVKARALGARAVLAGRPWLMALGAGGKPGVDRMLALLREDVDRTLAMLGVPSLDAVDRGALRAASARQPAR